MWLWKKKIFASNSTKKCHTAKLTTVLYRPVLTRNLTLSPAFQFRAMAYQWVYRPGAILSKQRVSTRISQHLATDSLFQRIHCYHCHLDGPPGFDTRAYRWTHLQNAVASMETNGQMTNMTNYAQFLPRHRSYHCYLDMTLDLGVVLEKTVSFRLAMKRLQTHLVTLYHTVF